MSASWKQGERNALRSKSPTQQNSRRPFYFAEQFSGLFFLAAAKLPTGSSDRAKAETDRRRGTHGGEPPALSQIEAPRLLFEATQHLFVGGVVVGVRLARLALMNDERCRNIVG